MKITRGIKPEFAEAFSKSRLYELYMEHQDELFLGIRNDCINIYYNGASVCKVEVDSAGKLRCEVANKYIGKQPYFKTRFGKDGKSKKSVEYSTVKADDIVANYLSIKENIIKYYSKNEKIAQMRLVGRNNANIASGWYCIDIEYVRQRDNADENVYGRFDIIALSKATPHRVALIELKYGNKSMGAGSGILKHATDFIAFIDNREYEKHLKSELTDIVESMKMLGICPDALKDAEHLCNEPEFFFITLGNDEDKAKRTMRRYVLEGVERSSKHTVEKECGIDITKPNDKRFVPTFLFSTDKIGDIKITDIIDDRSYSKGL